MMIAEAVLDTSAVVAAIREEPGGDLVAHLLVKRRIAHHALFAHVLPADLELGLDQDQRITSGSQHLQDSGEHQGERNEGEIGHQDVHLLPDIFAAHVTEVELLPRNHSWIAPELPGELVRAHIEGEHLHGATLQQAVSKSSGGRTYIQSRHACHINVEVLECSFQF